MIDRDAVTELVDRVQVRGLGYMLLLYLLNGSTVNELHAMTRDERHTIGDCLRGLEMRQYVIRVQAGRSDKWFLSQTGLSIVHLNNGGNTTINGTDPALLDPVDGSKTTINGGFDGSKTTINGR